MSDIKPKFKVEEWYKDTRSQYSDMLFKITDIDEDLDTVTYNVYTLDRKYRHQCQDRSLPWFRKVCIPCKIKVLNNPITKELYKGRIIAETPEYLEVKYE